MTREEHIAALEKYRDGILSGGISVPYDDLMIALDASIAALHGPQPDPDTGLLPCGCGGKAGVTVIAQGGYSDNRKKHYVSCKTCGINTRNFKAQKDARVTWNRAMGEILPTTPNQARLLPTTITKRRWKDETY